MPCPCLGHAAPWRQRLGRTASWLRSRVTAVNHCKILALTWTLLAAPPLFAGVILSGTRVIYPASSRDVSIQLSNVGESPSVIQTWIDDGDAKATPDTIDVPFLITPPMFRIDPGKGQRLRMTYTGEGLPKDRESIFWLNVLDIPPKPKDLQDQNLLQFSVRTRLKIFFRPSELKGSAISSAEALEWSLQRETPEKWNIEARNSTPFAVSLSKISVLSGADEVATITPKMVMPFSTQVFPLNLDPKFKYQTPDTVGYQFVDDSGNSHTKNYKLSGQKSSDDTPQAQGKHE